MRPKPPSLPSALPRLPFALALRRRPRLRRALTAAAAVVIGLAVASAVRSADEARAAWGQAERVAVARRDLPAGHELEPGDVDLVELPAPAVPPGAVDEALDGQVVRSGVLEGEVLLRRRLAGPDVVGAAALVPAGRRGVAIPVDPGAVPPLVVGQRVDLVAIVAIDGEPRSAVVADGATVVHVEDVAVTVAVDPEVVPEVAAALAAGTVTLALIGS